MSYYIAPRFLNKLAVHISKNFMDLPGVRVPLILGIHGRKGEGKSFQCELVFQKMGIEPVHISGGELESPDAGDPARLLRLRYREAAELIRVRGKMCVLMINDLDAGAGRFDLTTQYTVNTQLVNATLMNIADNPTNVQLPGSYDSTPLHRVPIIVTGNDFSTLYAPLIRDGRMEKFYWEPSFEDKVGIAAGIFEADGLSHSDVQKLVETFSEQSVDFFGALRSRLYDEQILEFISQVGYDRVSARLVNSKERPPEFRKPNFNLPHLIEVGQVMSGESERVRQMRLVHEYNAGIERGDRISPETVKAVSRYQENRKTVDRNEIANEVKPAVASGNGGVKSENLSPEIVEELRSLAIGGYRIGIEYVDERRFRMNSWTSCASIAPNREEEAIAALQECLSQHPHDYVRLVAIDPKAKRRITEAIVQRPQG